MSGSFSPPAAGSAQVGARLVMVVNVVRLGFLAFAAGVLIVRTHPAHAGLSWSLLATGLLASLIIPLQRFVGPALGTFVTRAFPVFPVVEIIGVTAFLAITGPARDQLWVLYLLPLLLTGFIYPAVLAFATGVGAGLLFLVTSRFDPHPSSSLEWALGFAFPGLTISIAMVAGAFARDRAQKTDEIDRLREQTQRVAEAFHALAAGDLSGRRRIEVVDGLGPVQEAFGEAALEFDGMVAALRSAVEVAQRGGDRVQTSATSLAAEARGEAQMAEEASAAADQVVETVGDLAVGAVTIAELTERVVKLAKKASVSAEMGRESVITSQRALTAISRRVGDISGQSGRLVELSAGIFRFLTLIDEIADQTSLLALNAAIEAARAGEEGRGFAVVADEVRKLAERATRATHEVRSLVHDVRQEITATASATSAGSEEVDRGSRLADEAARALDRIKVSVDEIATGVSDIEKVTLRQRGSSSGAVAAVGTVSEASRRFAEGSAAVREQADELAQLSDGLRVALARFQLTEAVLDDRGDPADD